MAEASLIAARCSRQVIAQLAGSWPKYGNLPAKYPTSEPQSSGKCPRPMEAHRQKGSAPRSREANPAHRSAWWRFRRARAALIGRVRVPRRAVPATLPQLRPAEVIAGHSITGAGRQLCPNWLQKQVAGLERPAELRSAGTGERDTPSRDVFGSVD